MKTLNNARDALVQLLLHRLGGETWIKIPEGLSADHRASFLNVLMIDGVKTSITGNVVSLTVEKPPASLDFIKP